MQDGKVAVVTGGSSGIGRATAIGLSRAGYRVAICGRRRAELDSAVAEGGLTLAAPCDVSDAEQVAGFFETVRARLGRVDLVFNNAGRFAPSTNFGDLPVETWRAMVDVNLNGAFYVAREAFRAMRAQQPQGRRIINNGSISAYAPAAGRRVLHRY